MRQKEAALTFFPKAGAQEGLPTSRPRASRDATVGARARFVIIAARAAGARGKNSPAHHQLRVLWGQFRHAADVQPVQVVALLQRRPPEAALVCLLGHFASCFYSASNFSSGRRTSPSVGALRLRWLPVLKINRSPSRSWHCLHHRAANLRPPHVVFVASQRKNCCCAANAKRCDIAALTIRNSTGFLFLLFRILNFFLYFLPINLQHSAGPRTRLLVWPRHQRCQRPCYPRNRIWPSNQLNQELHRFVMSCTMGGK